MEENSIKLCLYWGSEEAHGYLWNVSGTVLELTHNYGTEKKEDFKYHPGNQENDGFGHIAFNCLDVYDACNKLEQHGVTFKKKPDEGMMSLLFISNYRGHMVVVRSTRKL